MQVISDKWGRRTSSKHTKALRTALLSIEPARWMASQKTTPAEAAAAWIPVAESFVNCKKLLANAGPLPNRGSEKFKLGSHTAAEKLYSACHPAVSRNT